PFLEGNAGMPIQDMTRTRDIGAALLGIVLRQRLRLDRGSRAGFLEHQRRQLVDREFARVAEIDRPGHRGRRIHQGDEAINQVCDIAERSCLRAVAGHRQWTPVQSLHDEIRDHAAVVGLHSRPIGVEDARDLDPDAVLPMIIEEQGFCGPLSFIITGSRPDRVHMAPVVLGLRMLLRIAIDLARGRLKNARVEPLGETEHVDGAKHARLYRVNRVVLIVYRTRRAGEVVDLVDLDIDRKHDIVPHKLKMRMTLQMRNVAAPAGYKTVETNDLVSALEKALAQMRPYKAGAAANQ